MSTISDRTGPQWWLTEVRIGSERTCSAWLSEVDVETCTPMALEPYGKRRRGEKQKARRRAVLPGYVIARFDRIRVPSLMWRSVQARKFCWRPIFTAEGPMVRVRDSDVASLREREEAEEFVFVQQDKPPVVLNVGDRVRVPFDPEFTTPVISIDSEGFAVLGAVFLGRSARAHISRLEKVT